MPLSNRDWTDWKHHAMLITTPGRILPCALMCPEYLQIEAQQKLHQYTHEHVHDSLVRSMANLSLFKLGSNPDPLPQVRPPYPELQGLYPDTFSRTDSPTLGSEELNPTINSPTVYRPEEYQETNHRPNTLPKTPDGKAPPDSLNGVRLLPIGVAQKRYRRSSLDRPHTSTGTAGRPIEGKDAGEVEDQRCTRSRHLLKMRRLFGS